MLKGSLTASAAYKVVTSAAKSTSTNKGTGYVARSCVR